MNYYQDIIIQLIDGPSDTLETLKRVKAMIETYSDELEVKVGELRDLSNKADEYIMEIEAFEDEDENDDLHDANEKASYWLDTVDVEN